MAQESGSEAGQIPELTRFDEPYLSADLKLRRAVLANGHVQTALIKIGPRGTGVDLLRSMRIYMLGQALRHVLTDGEIDHHAHTIQARRKEGIWPADAEPLSITGGRSLTVGRDGSEGRKRRGPDDATIQAAAAALGKCAQALLAGIPEDLCGLRESKYELGALHRVLDFLGHPHGTARVRYRPSTSPFYDSSATVRGPQAERKRRQRARAAQAEIVAAERSALDAQVASGTIRRWEQSDSDELADRLGTPRMPLGEDVVVYVST